MRLIDYSSLGDNNEYESPIIMRPYLFERSLTLMKTSICRVLGFFLLMGMLLFPSGSPVQAADTTCNPVPVTVDIKPGSDPAAINLNSSGVVPVAVLTTASFDASRFTPEMAHLTDANVGLTMPCTGAMAIRWALEDVNGDGKPDLVFFFNTQDLNLTANSTAAMLMAHGSYGSAPLHIMGTDAVVIVH